MNALASQAHRHYQRTQVETANPAKLILMLYDGAIRKLNQSVISLESGPKEAFPNDIVKVQKIIMELMSALDPSKNVEVASNLERLYDYMLRQLGVALIRRDATSVNEVKSLLEDLREGWQGAIDQLAQEAAAAGAIAEGQGQPVNPSQVRPGAYSSKVQPGLIPTLNIAG